MFVTFYSYKGGVGRSLALANIACLLGEDKEDPQRVLLWDFDLEAPGLQRLFPPKSAQVPGFVDLVHNYALTGMVPDVRQHIYRSEVKGIDVLGAGSIGNEYCSKLESIDWPNLFTEEPTESGHFFSQLLSDIDSLGYDYVLVDSRTGFNDQASICTQVLSDIIVVVFRLTPQNLDGLEYLIPTLSEQLLARGKESVAIVPVASQVPSYSSQLIRQRNHANQIFGTSIRHIRFDPDLVSDEALYSRRDEIERRWPLPSVIDDYSKLCQHLRKKNQEDTRTASALLTRRIHADDSTSAVPLLKFLLPKRPHRSRLWKILDRVCSESPRLREEFETIIDGIISDNPVGYAYDWKAHELLLKADSVSSENLDEALQCLNTAARLPGGKSPSRLRRIASIASCKGDIDRAIDALKLAAEIEEQRDESFAKNQRMALELAKLFVRKGSGYFGAAIEELKDIPEQHEQYSRDAMLIFLYSLIGEKENADSLLDQMDQMRTFTIGFPVNDLVRSYSELFSGHRESALARANDYLASCSSASDVANWAELLICCGRADQVFERYSSLLIDAGYKSLVLLAEYVSKKTSNREEVLESWKRWNWSLMELTMFYGFSRDHETSEYDREHIDIIEHLNRQLELEALKGPRRAISWFEA